MRLLGKRSLASFLKVLLDVAFYGMFVVFALLFVVAWVAQRSDSVGTSLNFGVYFQLDPSVYEIESETAPHLEIERAEYARRPEGPVAASSRTPAGTW